ncbi:hypothetical protein JK628_16775 [Shewanella sp. KX20019]|uniref:hypothetical protein n=1 Tax=Shewanella sp. KX20019 TaxID=2803864 RepID=UPI001927F7A3|nr:hypothetical protein [Shewanella sp. KX20019]QQX79195.1 hypothetical protein JK628_16775 [Shewanella sp. KX20019]
MQLFWRFGFILLFMGGLFLTPMSASASEQNQNHTHTQQPALTTADEQVNVQSLSVQDLDIEAPLILTLLEPSAKTPLKIEDNLQGRHLKQTEGHSSEYAPLVSQRFMSFAQHERLQSRPDYRLAFEFVSPPVPSLTVGYRMDFAPAVDWQLHVGGSSFRLSAWKESNLLYRLSHTRSIS